ncbi:MAG: hypothetical protein JSR76_07555 [Verrucomicrobia bacterium]|jgi:hypothetical protein|nr:hypothetical protein [Verrucomicrobiota bacterium]
MEEKFKEIWQKFKEKKPGMPKPLHPDLLKELSEEERALLEAFLSCLQAKESLPLAKKEGSPSLLSAVVTPVEEEKLFSKNKHKKLVAFFAVAEALLIQLPISEDKLLALEIFLKTVAKWAKELEPILALFTYFKKNMEFSFDPEGPQKKLLKAIQHLLAIL